MKPTPTNPKEEWKLPTSEQTVNPLCKYHISKGVKVPSDINIEIKPHANRWITSGNKKIDIRGPVFTMVRMEVDG
ncbi:MAG: hypothetical protein ACXQTY_00705 [Candidatus Methanogasteraceae archaeon]